MAGGNSITWRGKLNGERPRLAAVHGRAEERRRVRLQRPPDVLGWQRRRMVGRGQLRHACRARRGAGRDTPRAGRIDSGKTIAIIALVVGALGARRRRRRPRRGEAFGMSLGGRAGALLVALVVALALPAVAWGTPRCSRRSRRRAACSPNRRTRSASPSASTSSRASPSSRSPTPHGTQQIAGSPATRGRRRTRSSCPLHRSRRAGTWSGGA